MKQYLLFAGMKSAATVGVHGLAGDFDSVAEACLSLVDRQTPGEWWHVLDTRTGEITERRHIRTKNGMISFQKSDWVAGQATEQTPHLPPAKGLDELEADLQSVMAIAITDESSPSGGYANGAAAEN